MVKTLERVMRWNRVPGSFSHRSKFKPGGYSRQIRARDWATQGPRLLENVGPIHPRAEWGEMMGAENPSRDAGRLATGAELKARRKAHGWTQRQLAARAEVSREAVQYWERRDVLDVRGWAVVRLAVALCWTLPAPPRKPHPPAQDAWATFAAIDREAVAEAERREAERGAKRRVICGAKTRKGTPCRAKSEPGRTRCRFHGGKSTGPRTPEGRERVAEAQRKRWAAYREAKARADA